MPSYVLIVSQDRSHPSEQYRFRRGDLVTSYPEMPPPNCGAADISLFYIYEITDEDNENVSRALFRPWNRVIDMTVTEGEGVPGLKTILVRNNSANASETIGGWTPEQTANIAEAWNDRYSPDPNAGRDLVITGYPAYNVFECQGTFTEGEKDDFERAVIEGGEVYVDRKAVYGFSSQAMDFMDANGGRDSGTKVQFQNRLVDKRLS